MGRPSAIHLLYIPGLGDGYDILRQCALWGWRQKGLRIVFVPMQWNNIRESYLEKVERLDTAISLCSGKRVVLVGESAGGAMAIAYGLRNPRVEAIITLCGKNKGSKRVKTSIYHRHPAFKEALQAAEAALVASTQKDRERVSTVYSPRDRTVPPADTLIPDAKSVVLKLPGHFLTIMLALTVSKQRIIRLL